MAQFGKRGAVGAPRVPNRPPVQPNVAAAPAMPAGSETIAVHAPRSEDAASSVRHVFLLLIAAAGFWFFVIPYAGDLIRDHRLSGSWQPAYDLQVADARCKRYNFVFTLCSAQLKSRARLDQPQTAVEYMMLFARGADPLVPVRSTIDASAVTIGAAVQSHLANRTITFLTLTLGFAAVFLVGLALLLSGGGGARRVDRETARDVGDMKAGIGTA